MRFLVEKVAGSKRFFVVDIFVKILKNPPVF